MKKEPASSVPIHPRYGLPAISWSDLNLIERNTARWLYQKRVSSTLAMDYGTSVHARIAHRQITVPRGTNPETSLAHNVRIGRKEHFYIVGTPDDFDYETIYEYKTGTKLWSRKQAEDHGQFPAYALLLQKEFGRSYKKGVLVSLETRFDRDLDDMVLTGKQRVINREIKEVEILEMYNRFINAYKKVKNYVTNNNHTRTA